VPSKRARRMPWFFHKNGRKQSFFIMTHEGPYHQFQSQGLWILICLSSSWSISYSIASLLRITQHCCFWTTTPHTVWPQSPPHTTTRFYGLLQTAYATESGKFLVDNPRWALVLILWSAYFRVATVQKAKLYFPLNWNLPRHFFQ
jgi:hypothetical protein